MTQVSDRRRLFILLLSAAVVLVVAWLMLSCDAASAATPVTTDNILDRFKNKSTEIGAKIEEYAKWLFWCLAFIEFSWASIQVGVRGEMSLGALWSMLFKQIMLIGIFYFLLQNWGSMADAIVGGLGKVLPETISGTDYNPTDVIAKGITALWANVEAGWKGGWSDFAVGILAGIVMFFAFSLAAGALCVYMVEWYVSVPCGVIVLGLGGSSWTKSYVESYIRFLISLGLKILSLKIVLMIIIDYLDEFVKDMDASAGNSDFLAAGATLASLSMISYMVIQQIPGLTASLISGASMQSGASTLTGAVASAGKNMQSVGNAAQTGAQSATRAASTMSGVAKTAGAAAGNTFQGVRNKLGGGGEGEGGGGSLKSALRHDAATVAAGIAAGVVGGASVARSAVKGAGAGIAKWAGISKQETPQEQIARNVEAIANKLGVNNDQGNQITPGTPPKDDSPPKNEGAPDHDPGSREGAVQSMNEMAEATNEGNRQGDTV